MKTSTLLLCALLFYGCTYEVPVDLEQENTTDSQPAIDNLKILCEQQNLHDLYCGEEQGFMHKDFFNCYELGDYIEPCIVEMENLATCTVSLSASRDDCISQRCDSVKGDFLSCVDEYELQDSLVVSLPDEYFEWCIEIEEIRNVCPGSAIDKYNCNIFTNPRAGECFAEYLNIFDCIETFDNEDDWCTDLRSANNRCVRETMDFERCLET